MLVASHDMMVIHRMERRIVTLEEGRIIEDTEKVLLPRHDLYAPLQPQVIDEPHLDVTPDVVAESAPEPQVDAVMEPHLEQTPASEPDPAEESASDV